MQPKIPNATFATGCNPYQKMRYNSKESVVQQGQQGLRSLFYCCFNFGYLGSSGSMLFSQVIRDRLQKMNIVIGQLGQIQ